MRVVLRRNWGKIILCRGRQGFVGLMHLECGGHKDTCERGKSA
jgi:hypothetical protein